MRYFVIDYWLLTIEKAPFKADTTWMHLIIIIWIPVLDYNGFIMIHCKGSTMSNIVDTCRFIVTDLQWVIFWIKLGAILSCPLELPFKLQWGQQCGINICQTWLLPFTSLDWARIGGCFSSSHFEGGWETKPQKSNC